MNIYRATSPKVWEILHTNVRLRFDFEKKEAIGAVTLKMQPVAGAVDTLALDAKGMAFTKVGLREASGGNFQPLPYNYDGNQIKICVRGLDFGKPELPDLQSIYLEYVARPYAAPVSGSAAIVEDRGLYFINTDHAKPDKPVQIWTQGETESNSHWLPTIDKPNQRTTLDLTLIVPDTMLTLSNGKLFSEKFLGNGMREDIWLMEQPIQVYAIMFAVGRFDITKDTWQDPSGKLREVHYYTEPAYAPYAQAMFHNTPEMLSLFSRTTGVTYPWEKYSQIVVRDYVSGAMENTSATLFGEWMNQDNRMLLDATTDDVVAHELFHQWFGDYVTAESWSNLTLNESFATYGTLIWRRYKLGAASASVQAFNDLRTYLGAAEKSDPPLVRYHYRDREDMFDRTSYEKGACILNYINSITGEILFNRAMKIYLTRNALKSAEASQWRTALEESTGKDWTEFFDQWYYHGGHPQLNVHYAYDDAARVLNITVRQASSPDSSFVYNLPLKTLVAYGDKQRMEDWTISKRSQSFTYPYEHGVRPLIIPDALSALPGEIKEDKTPAEYLLQIKASRDYGSKRRAIAGAVAAPNDPRSLKIFEAGLSDSLEEIRINTLYQLSRIKTQSWRDTLQRRVSGFLQKENSNSIRAAAMTVAGEWKLKTELPEIVASISDSSYVVAGSALYALRQLNEDSAYHVAKKMLSTHPKGYLKDAAWYTIVLKGVPADISDFESRASLVDGAEKVRFAYFLGRYAEAVNDDSVYAQTLKLLTQMAAHEESRTNRYAIGAGVFQRRETYQKQAAAKKGSDVGVARKRLKLTEPFIAQILAGEKDEKNLEAYGKIGK